MGKAGFCLIDQPNKADTCIVGTLAMPTWHVGSASRANLHFGSLRQIFLLADILHMSADYLGSYLPVFISVQLSQLAYYQLT